MPFSSKKQQKFAYSNPEKFGGETGLKEWSDATDQSSLPEVAKKSKKFSYAPQKTRAGYTQEQKVA